MRITLLLLRSSHVTIVFEYVYAFFYGTFFGFACRFGYRKHYYVGLADS